MHTDDLIRHLAQGLAPVRRVPSPWSAAASWLLLALIVLGICVAVSGFRHDLAERLMLTEERINLAAALLTGLAAAVAAFQLALPDRSGRWALLPLPFAALWLSGLGWGCLRDLAEDGTLGLGTSFGCLRFIIAFGVPLTAAMLWMTRHAGPIRPAPVAALGGLAAAATASVGLSLVHHLDAAAMVLIWHGGSIAIVTLGAWLLGPRAMRAMT
ncbi:NrsF family protein [Falsiroseomonas sp. HW251]|uniref:NrsF family protein n=1 Tax=Falsiroseomonas sp. HW251 TaxID=3390998 RepID=UPI003D321110